MLQKIIKSVLTFLGLVETDAEKIIGGAEVLVTKAMALEQTSTFQDLIEVVELAFPASTPIVNAINLALPSIFKTMNWISGELELTGDQQWQQALTYLLSLPYPEKAAQLNSFAALVGNIANMVEGTSLTIQQLLTTAQPAHSPLVLA